MVVEFVSLVISAVTLAIFILYIIITQKELKQIKMQLPQTSSSKKRQEKRTETKIDEQQEVEETPTQESAYDFEPYCEVLSQISPQGDSYEFKVRCWGCDHAHSTLEDCFFYEIDSVVVYTPNEASYELFKDYTTDPYSGEVRRSWISYGNPGDGLPAAGRYVFDFIKDGESLFTKEIEFSHNLISSPTNVAWERRENDLFIEWNPPYDLNDSMWYKITIWNQEGTPDLNISQDLDPNANDCIFKDVEFVEGGNYLFNVSIFSEGVHAQSDYVFFTW